MWRLIRGLNERPCKAFAPEILRNRCFGTKKKKTVRPVEREVVSFSMEREGCTSADADADTVEKIHLQNVQKVTWGMKGAIVHYRKQLQFLSVESLQAHGLDGLQIGGVQPGEYLALMQLGSIRMESMKHWSFTIDEPEFISRIVDKLRQVNPCYDIQTLERKIDVWMPKPTKEVRKQLMGIAKAQAEKARQQVRRVRQDGMNVTKKHSKSISEDKLRDQLLEIQQLHDTSILQIAEVYESKITELSTL